MIWRQQQRGLQPPAERNWGCEQVSSLSERAAEAESSMKGRLPQVLRLTLSSLSPVNNHQIQHARSSDLNPKDAQTSLGDAYCLTGDEVPCQSDSQSSPDLRATGAPSSL
ncbi:hypothetical protein JEQ12_000107 [Ovis aries]|uniref:Uncharacterized protein n=1 Tax=Ovis aries TaxID=9940 RepID=A0A836APB7_SHEEP|nr:hypothetical protein JEQ12_000107 [Ovis aries]